MEPGGVKDGEGAGGGLTGAAGAGGAGGVASRET